MWCVWVYRLLDDRFNFVLVVLARLKRLYEIKANGAKARSSEELKFLSSQAALSYRAAVANNVRRP